MGNMKLDLQDAKKKPQDETKPQKVKAEELLTWETPKMEDVSEQVMAQPDIRFT